MKQKQCYLLNNHAKHVWTMAGDLYECPGKSNNNSRAKDKKEK